jgi:hypothetical protein
MSRRDRICLAVAVALVLAFPAAAAGHVEKRSGPFRVTMGWAEEPAYSGSLNAVEVEVAGRDGAPTAVPPGSLDVEVTFGKALASMEPVPTDERGKLQAKIIPTRPGTYAFHVTGAVRGQAIDAQATCGGATFDCVLEPAGIQFPVKEPSPGQLAERVERGLPRAERAAEDADGGQTIAVIALVVAGLSLAMGTAAVARQRRS